MTNWTQKQSQKGAAIFSNIAVPEILHLLVSLVLTENENLSLKIYRKNIVLLKKVKLLKDIIVITCASQRTEVVSFL